MGPNPVLVAPSLASVKATLASEAPGFLPGPDRYLPLVVLLSFSWDRDKSEDCDHLLLSREGPGWAQAAEDGSCQRTRTVSVRERGEASGGTGVMGNRSPILA